MVGRPEATHAPQGAGQQAIREYVALAPPLVPNGAKVFVAAGARTGQFRREQAADAEQAGLQGEWRGVRIKPARPQLSQALHGPDIVLVSQGAKKSLPYRLLPPPLPRPRL